MKPRCTTGKERRISRWEHEDILDVVQERLEGVGREPFLHRPLAVHRQPLMTLASVTPGKPAAASSARVSTRPYMDTAQFAKLIFV
jgi:hypothetical protein